MKWQPNLSRQEEYTLSYYKRKGGYFLHSARLTYDEVQRH